MLRLILLLCAGAYIYSLGHNAAVAPSAVAPSATAAARPSMVAGVASAGAAWIAREVHERTAWAAERPAETTTTAQPAREPPAYAPPVAAAFVPAAPAGADPAAAPHRRLQVIIEPEITLAAR